MNNLSRAFNKETKMFQLNLAFKKRSFWVAFSVALFFSVLSFVLACIECYGHEINVIASAEKLLFGELEKTEFS